MCHDRWHCHGHVPKQMPTSGVASTSSLGGRSPASRDAIGGQATARVQATGVAGLQSGRLSLLWQAPATTSIPPYAEIEGDKYTEAVVDEANRDDSRSSNADSAFFLNHAPEESPQTAPLQKVGSPCMYQELAKKIHELPGSLTKNNAHK